MALLVTQDVTQVIVPSTMEEEAESKRSRSATRKKRPGPARALTLHLLRMLETRADAAGIALQSEIQSFQSTPAVATAGGRAMFIAIWGGIVLLAIALPPHLRVPVLSAVMVAVRHRRGVRRSSSRSARCLRATWAR